MEDFLKYEQYKDSGVEWLGEVPEHWEVIKSKFLWQEKIDLAKTDDNLLLSVSQYVGVVPRAGKTRSESLVGYKKVEKDDLVINIMLAWLGGLGLSDFDGVVSPAYAVYRKTKDVEPKFLHYLYRTKSYLSEFARRSTGVVPSRWRMYTESFGQVLTVLPPKKEQTHIAVFLDQKTEQIDRAIAQKERLIERLQERRKILIHRAVTRGLNAEVEMKDSGVDWIGEVPVHWGVCALGYMARVDTGSTPDRSQMNYWNGNIPWVKTGEIRYSQINETQEYISERGLRNSATRLAPVGTILMAMYGQGVTRGRVGILGIPATYNQACAAISVNRRLYNLFVYYYFVAMYSFFRESGNETSQMNLSSGYIKKIKITLPPKNEQNIIVNRCKKIEAKFDDAKSLLEQQIQTLKEYKATLINAAVTGQIKVG